MYLSVARSWHSKFPSASGKTAKLYEMHQAFVKQSKAQYMAYEALVEMITGAVYKNGVPMFYKYGVWIFRTRCKLPCSWAMAFMMISSNVKTVHKTQHNGMVHDFMKITGL